MIGLPSEDHSICKFVHRNIYNIPRTGFVPTLYQFAINSVKTTLDAIIGAGLPLSAELINNLITKDVTPSVNKAKEITPATVTLLLNQLDHDRKSWTVEDIH